MDDADSHGREPWPEPWFATAPDGTQLAVHDLGTGPTVVLLHGLPELARSWRHQLSALAAAGYRVLAPDQRGCGASDVPRHVEAYDVHHLTADVVAILDAAEVDRAVLVGHDAATMTAQWTAYLHPERVLGIAGMAPPFMPPFPMSPVELMRSLFGDRHQFVAFQEPDVPEQVLEQDVRRSLRNLFRVGLTKEQASAGGFPFILDVVRQPVPVGDDLLDPAELDRFVEAYERTGFVATVHWFRNLERNWRTTQGTDPHLHVPVLYLRGEHGDQVPDFAALVFQDYVDDFEWHLLEGIGHWTQQEAPDLVNELLLAWLDRVLSDVRAPRQGLATLS